jgi:hypothetical protein
VSCDERGGEGRGLAAALEAVEAAVSASFIRRSIRQFRIAVLAVSRLPKVDCPGP